MSTRAADDVFAPWQVTQLGPMADWGDFVHELPNGPSMQGKAFLRTRLGLTGLEASVNALPPGQAYGFSHAHRQNEELYLFLTGTGEMLLDDRVVPVGAGTAVRIAPAVFRCWRNTGAEPLTCVVVQAKAGSLEQATHKDGIRANQPPNWP
jgi:mannose-6-phosphate isomerase-like protein (cupin superfamily)